MQLWKRHMETLLECLGLTGGFQLHSALKSHRVVSQLLAEQPKVYTQLPPSLQTLSESSSCAWGSSSHLDTQSFVLLLVVVFGGL